MKWYKRDPDAFKGGVAALTLEEVGAYTLILDELYSRDGSVPDDIVYLTRLLRCDPRVCRRVRQRLLDLGKIKNVDGLITNGRATLEIDAANVRLSLRQNISENNAPKPVRARATTTSTTTTREEGKTECAEQDGRSNDRPTLSVATAFDEFWKHYPHKVGKDAARRSFARIAKSKKVLFSEIMAGLARYIVEKPRDRNWCNPATWLNQGRWCDQPAPPVDARSPPRPGSNEHQQEELHNVVERLKQHAGLAPQADDEYGSGGTSDADARRLPIAKAS